MFDRPQVMKLASALMDHAADRQKLVSRNIANADTPGYVPCDLKGFAGRYDSAEDAGMRATRPSHLGNDTPSTRRSEEMALTAHMSPDGNGVSIEAEMARAADVRREHELALAVYGKSLAILRASLGRS